MQTLETLALLSVAEAATILRVSRATTYRLVERGDLPAHQVGGQYRIDRRELLAWLYARPGDKPTTAEAAA